jgi:AcrR family transcriptional regulator
MTQAIDDFEDTKLTGKAATQERILLAATRLFLDHGYEQTTVAQVATEAGVSRATVFWHFSDKASLFREAFNRLVEPFRVSLERNFDDLEPEKRLSEQIALYQSFAARHRPALEGFVRWAVEAQGFREAMINTLLDMHQRYNGVLAETIAEIAPPEHDPKALATGLIVLMDGDLILSFFDTSTRRAEERSLAIDTVAALIPRRSQTLADSLPRPSRSSVK